MECSDDCTLEHPRIRILDPRAQIFQQDGRVMTGVERASAGARFFTLRWMPLFGKAGAMNESNSAKKEDLLF